MVHYTNTASTPKQYVSQGGQADSAKNCEFCTAAGAVNLIVGTGQETSGNAAGEAGLKDARPNDDLPDQTKRIRGFVEKNTQRTAKVLGSKDNQVDYAEAVRWMKSQPDRCVFAVYVSGTLASALGQGINAGNQKSHWLNAMLAGGTIRYFDFQANRKPMDRPVYGFKDFTGAFNPASATVPFVGVVSQMLLHSHQSKGMRSDDQAGALNPDTW